MAKTVSRSGDNGESTPVPVIDLGGHIEDHRADPADLSAARVATVTPTSFKGMKDIKTGDWIENLMDSSTVFSSPKGSFKLAAVGIHGSIQPIQEEIRQDAFVLRAVQRKTKPWTRSLILGTKATRVKVTLTDFVKASVQEPVKTMVCTRIHCQMKQSQRVRPKALKKSGHLALVPLSQKTYKPGGSEKFHR